METLTQTKTKMTCDKCGVSCKRFGKHRNGLQRFRCALCGSTYTEEHAPSFRVEDYLKTKRGIMALKLLVEGCSIRSIERLTGIRRDTIIDLLLIAGERCERLMNTMIQDVPVRDVQADEIWSFIGKKEKRKTFDDDDTLGDSYYLFLLGYAALDGYYGVFGLDIKSLDLPSYTFPLYSILAVKQSVVWTIILTLLGLYLFWSAALIPSWPSGKIFSRVLTFLKWIVVASVLAFVGLLPVNSAEANGKQEARSAEQTAPRAHLTFKTVEKTAVRLSIIKGE